MGWLMGFDRQGDRSLDTLYDTTGVSALTVFSLHGEFCDGEFADIEASSTNDNQTTMRGVIEWLEQGPSGRHYPAHLLFSAHPSSSPTRAPPTSRRRCPATPQTLPPSLSLSSLYLSLSLSSPPPPTSALPCFPRNNLRRHRTSRRLPSPRSSPSAVSTPLLTILRYCRSMPHFPSTASSSFARAP